MSRELKRILELSNKAVTEVRGPLARMYRQILADVGITLYKFDEFVNEWLDKSSEQFQREGKSRATERGNIIQEITRPDMTIKVFMKRLKLLPIVKVRLIAEIEWKEGHVTHHIVPVNLNEDCEHE